MQLGTLRLAHKFVVCAHLRENERTVEMEREDAVRMMEKRGRGKKRKSCLAFLTQQPYREDMVPLPYILSGGTDFKPDFSIIGLNLQHRGLTYSHLCIHTEFLASKN